MADNEIGAHIVLTGESTGAQAAIEAATEKVGRLRDENGRFVQSATEAGQAAEQAGEGIKKLHENTGEGSTEEGLEKLKDSLKEFVQQVPGGSSAMSAFGEVAEGVAMGPFGVLAVAITAASAAIEVLKHGVEEFEKIESADTKVDAALANIGELTDQTREKIQALAKEQQEATGIVEESWAGVYARLKQFGADDTHLEEYGEAVKNLAGLLGGDIEAAGRRFTAVLGGNYNALHRLGIEVDKNADSQTKLREIMEQLREKGAGQLEEQTKTLSGKLRTLENSVADLFKAIGGLVSRTGLLQEGIRGVTWVFKELGALLPEVVQKVDGLENKIPTLEQALRNARSRAIEAREGMDEMGTGAEGAKESAEDLAKQGLDSLKDSLDAVSEKTKTAITDLEKLQQQQDKMESADLALKIAKIKAGPGTDDEKLVAERDARKQFADAKEARADRVDQSKIDALRADTEEKNRLAQDAANKVEVAKSPLPTIDEHRAAAAAAFDKNRAAEQEQAEQTKHDEKSERPDRDRILAFDHEQAARLVKQREALTIEAGRLEALRTQVENEAKAAQQIADKAQQEADANSQKNATQIVGIRQEQSTRRYVHADEQEQTTVENAATDAERRATRDREQRQQRREIVQRGLTDRTVPLDQRQRSLDELDRLENADAADKQRKGGPDAVGDQNRQQAQLERRVKQLEDSFKFRQENDPNAQRLSPEQDAVFETGVRGAVKAGVPISDGLLRQLAAEAARLVPTLSRDVGHTGETHHDPAAHGPVRPVIEGYSPTRQGDYEKGGLTSGGLATGGLNAGSSALSSASAALRQAPSAADVLAAVGKHPDPTAQQDAYHQAVMDVLKDQAATAAKMQEKLRQNTSELWQLKTRLKNNP